MTSTIAQSISFYGYIFTSPLGFIGHVCSLITFSSKTLRLTSTGLLFIFLTLSDTLYLLISINDFITITLQVPTLMNIHLCHFCVFMLNFSTNTSSWILVLIALDRLIRVRFPFRQARLCTPKVAACAMAILCVCSTAFTCHLLLPEVSVIIPKTNICLPPRFPPTSYSVFYFNVWPILQAIVTYFIPSCLMILCVVGMYRKIRVQHNLAGISRRRERLQRQMLILVMSSIGCFILCTWPFSIYFVVSFRFDTFSPSLIETHILVVLLNMNYCYNFYLHCLSSRLFRETFIQQLKLFYTWCKRPNNNNAVYPLPAVVRIPALPS